MGGPRAIQITAGVGPLEEFNYPSKASHATLFRLRSACREANSEVLQKYRAIKFTDLYLGSRASLFTAEADCRRCILLDDKEDVVDFSLCCIRTFLEGFLHDGTNTRPQLQSISIPDAVLWLATHSGVQKLYAVHGQDFAPQMEKRFFKKDWGYDFKDEVSFHEIIAERIEMRRLWRMLLAKGQVLKGLMDIKLEFLHFEGAKCKSSQLYLEDQFVGSILEVGYMQDPSSIVS
ncbi:hypothetical protein DL98DRAFT_532897 [Cadophora sp. DSE1049]|nr:hypothetical protein DL98DRAFT_532897 [Cadophora sp. DSE1049]